MAIYRIVRNIDGKAMNFSQALGTYWAAVQGDNEVHFGPNGAAYVVYALTAAGANVVMEDTSGGGLPGDPHL